MRDFQRPMPASRRDVTADSGAILRTLAHLWPYIWPANRRDLKNRVILATVLLFVAKLATVAVPFTFKWATDALAGHGTAPLGPDNILAWALATPVMMTLAYGGMRILMAALTQLRDGIFAKVAMNAVRRLAMLTFDHMHMLSLRFHLERKTGGLTRVLERGRNAIETIVRMVLLQLAPTIVELALIVAVLLFHFDWRYVVVITITVALYMWFTYLRHRMAHQHPPRDEFERHRRQRQGDRFAAQLRDGEIFLRRGARRRALRPLDGALRGGERQGLRLARRPQCRAGGGVHARARRHHGAVRLRYRARHQHRRRFRHDQRHDDPALPAAEFHGPGLSRDQAGGDRHRDHVLDAVAQARDRGQTGRQAAAGARRHHPLRQCLVRL